MICPTCNYDNLPGSEQCANCLNDLTHLDLPEAHDRVERSLMHDPVLVLRPRPAVVLPAAATVGQAIQTMLEHNIGALPVVDADGRLLGILSERDLLLRVAGLVDDYAGRPVREFMTPGPETVRESDTLDFVLHKMDGGGYRHLPVLRDGRVLGMISVRDVLRHITRLCGAGCG
jgi:CBS domain-containing protein